MRTRYFYPDKDDKISFTKKELEKLLDEVYKDGYNDGKGSVWSWTPSWQYWPYTCATANTTTTAEVPVANNSITSNSTPIKFTY